MAGLVPATHAHRRARCAWVLGTSPRMTVVGGTVVQDDGVQGRKRLHGHLMGLVSDQRGAVRGEERVQAAPRIGVLKTLTFFMFAMFAMTTDSVGVIIPQVIRRYSLGMTAGGAFQYATMSGIA